MIDTFDPEYRRSIVVFFLEDQGLYQSFESDYCGDLLKVRPC
jgi:hypothetical protein